MSIQDNREVGEQPVAVYHLGACRELFVDRFLIESTTARLVLQKPVRKEVGFVFDAPYEGSGIIYPVVFRDGERYRMYYIASHLTSEDGSVLYSDTDFYACYLESDDGISWHRPDLGLFEYQGNCHNNIVLGGKHTDNFTPFIDTRPGCPPEERYKAFEGYWEKLFAYHSSDAVHWQRYHEEGLDMPGTFDSSNLAFWDEQREHYWAYIRNFHDYREDNILSGIRDIRWSTSKDFIHWTEPRQITFADGDDPPLYVSNIVQYYRAPRFFLGFPARYIEKPWSPAFEQLSNPQHRRNRMEHSPRYGLAITDCIFMSSRDGKNWNKTREAFLRPGPVQPRNWVYGDGYLSVGMVETASDTAGEPDELSLYTLENHWITTQTLRRFTVRQDGFMALAAGAEAVETLTRPFTFTGSRLTLNLSTSAAGCIRVELQDWEGRPVPGYSLEECDVIFGDTLEYTVSWKGSRDVSGLSGRPIRMRLAMQDSDLFSYQFREN